MAEDYKRQSEELVRRCEAVGWQVVKTGKNYFKVDTRRGIFTISSTPGTAGSVRSTLATANRYGLEELEIKLREQNERERRARIQADRKANDAALDRIANGDGDVSTVVSVVATPTTERRPVDDLGAIDDGTAIVAVGSALIQTPVMSTPRPLKNGEELLLADERVVYRCTYVDDQTREVCHQVFTTVNGLQVHNSWHFRPIGQRPRHYKRTAGDHARESETVTVTTTTAPTATAATTVDDRELLITKLEELAGTIFDVGGRLIDVRNGLIQVAQDVKNLPAAVEPDPELVAKAAKFDALRGTLGGLFQ